MEVLIFIILLSALLEYFYSKSLRDTPKIGHNHPLNDLKSDGDSIAMFMSAEDKKAYLQSAKWQRMRSFKLTMNPVCECCGFGTTLEVHHITYKRLGNERPEDLAVVCRTCHQSIHDKYGYDRRTTYPIK